MTLCYVGIFIALVAILALSIGRLVTEDAQWGEPWVWIIFGAGVAVMWLDVIVPGL